MYVAKEAYEALAETFRKEAHSNEMPDLRHIIKERYTEEEMEKSVRESIDASMKK